MLYPLSTAAEQCAPKCSSLKPQKFIIFMILWVGWMALLLVSLELPHGAAFSWCAAWGLCLAGAAGMAGSFSLCTLLSQEGLVELLYRVLEFQVWEGDSCKTSWVLGSRTCTVSLTRHFICQSKPQDQPTVDMQQNIVAIFFQSTQSTKKPLTFCGQNQLRTDLKYLN